MIEPMTAAEYVRDVTLTARGQRILAALEERERLLGEVEGFRELARIRLRRVEVKEAEAIAARQELLAVQSDASLGALVRRIREHPEVSSPRLYLDTTKGMYISLLQGGHLTECLSHLDSLVPVEPKVVTGPSGREYRRRADGAVEIRDNDDENGRRIGWIALPTAIYACDAPVVAALMAKGGKDG